MQQVYARMSDDELQVVAGEAYDLTDVAKEVLQAEISSRGADIQLRLEPPSDNEPEPEPEVEEDLESLDPAELDLVKVLDLHDEEEARTAKWVLDNSGIPSFIGSNNVRNVEDYQGSFEKGVALKVRRDDCDAARRAFKDHWPEDRNDDAEPDLSEADVRCPKCHSDELVFESLEGETTDDSTLDTKFNWHCDACGHDWQDDGVEPEA